MTHGSTGTWATDAESSDVGTLAARALVIAVLTYRRYSQISGLVPELERQALGVEKSGIVETARVLVVDNEPGGGARACVEAAASDTTQYVVEPRPGIAAARNRALEAASTADLLVFIDDDEVPDDGWLAALVATAARYPGCAVSGPVRTRFNGPVDPWILDGGFLSREHRWLVQTGDPLEAAATNNLLLDMSVVRRLGLSFAEELGMSGGEDTHFTSSMVRNGGPIVWCADAWVTDVRPASRLSRWVVVRRVFGFANAAVRVQLMLAPRLRDRIQCVARFLGGGTARLGAGAVMLLVGVAIQHQPRRAKGVRLMARGLGTLSALAGYRHQEYLLANETQFG